MGRGTVSMRVAFVLRSTEVQPFVPAICVRTEELSYLRYAAFFLPYRFSTPTNNNQNTKRQLQQKGPLPTKHKTPPYPIHICLVYVRVCVYMCGTVPPTEVYHCCYNYKLPLHMGHIYRMVTEPLHTPSLGEECLPPFLPTYHLRVV